MPRPDSLVIRVLLTALVAFGPLSTDLYLPSLPILVRVFDTDIATVQLTLSVFLIGFAVSQLVYGPMSDRFGRRPTLLVGVSVYLVASAVCALTTSVEGLIAARFFQALGACCGPVVGRAVVRDVFGRDQAATVLAYMAMAMTLAPAIGPVLGGALTELFGWRSNFILLTGFAVAILAAVWSLLGETNTARDSEALNPGRMAANYLMLLRNRRFVGYVLIVACSYSGIFAFISGSSFLLIGQMHLSPAQFGMSFATVVLGYTLGSLLAGKLSRRLGGARMIRIGTLTSVGGGALGVGLALAGVLQIASVVAPVFLFILGAGLTLPNATANAVGPYPTMAGLASSLLGFFQMTIAALVGLGVGHLHDGTALPMMGAIGLVGLGALLSHRLLVVPGSEQPPASR